MVITYIGNIGYPNTAPSVHVKNRGIFMNSCGHEVYAFCESAPDENKMLNLVTNYICLFDYLFISS